MHSEISQPTLHHVNLKTTRLQQMIDWYGTVVGSKPNFQFPGGAWLTNDKANHRILKFFPKDKKIVLGLVTTKSGDMESADDLKRRIDQASRYVPLEQLALSPQCGFSSTVLGNNITVDAEIAKLSLVVRVAREVWG